MSHKIDCEEKKRKILGALKKPKTYKELGQTVGFHFMHKLVADLKAEKKIYHNDTDKVLELWR
jgi:hypothetical protein